MSLVLKLEHWGGFCWQMWLIAGFGLQAKHEGRGFYLDDTEYLFRHSQGWRDYFDTLNIVKPGVHINEPILLRTNHDTGSLLRFTLNEYKKWFQEHLVLNISLQEKLQANYEKLSLKPGKYGACMIRRGDKMFLEGKLISSEAYILPLIERGIKQIYVQTDDHQVYLDLCQYVKDHHPNDNIQIYTLCPEWKQGTICYKNEYEQIANGRGTSQNNSYIETLLQRFKKSVDEYSLSEIKDHTEEMLLGFELCCHSKHLVIDYQSNVSRYLYVRHDNPENVIVLDGPQVSFDLPFSSPQGRFA